MTELLTAAQMRAIEQAAIDSGEVTGLELMERAGRGVVEAIFEEWPELAKTDHRAVVLCGPGNNGGDGFVVARLLHEWGWEVEVFLYGDAGKLPPDARVNYERWREMGEVSGPAKDRGPFERVDIIVDALFGIGLNRGLEGKCADLIDLLFSEPVERPNCDLLFLQEIVVSIDVPSGYCADSGIWLGDHSSFEAALTVTFHTWKPGHFLFLGPADCGKVVRKDIGLGNTRLYCDFRLLNEIELLSDIKFEYREKHSGLNHKYDHGHALILSGGPGKGGAARLAARGALRIGAGVVTIGCPPAALQENAAQLNAIMLRPLKGGEGLAEVLQDTRINALCLGPGMGLGDHAADLLAVALGVETPDPTRSGMRPTAPREPDAPLALVLDADALSLIARAPDLFAALHENCILTPHAGEFARLFPDIAEKLNTPATKGPAYSKVDATREAAARAGCVVLFKGADTVIAAPDGRCSINSAHYERSAPWLATAGSGDVLAGFITGLLARGFAPMQAAETAAWLHVECALKFGPGLIAEDLPEQLPAVFRGLEVG